MLIKLDKYTCADFLNQGVSDVNLDILQMGCAGAKISISPRIIIDDRISSEECWGIRCWVISELAEKLDGSQVAQAKGKYYLVSKNIQSRCACGTSFSFEKKTVATNLAKIHRLQDALKLSPELSKIQQVLRNSLKK